LPPLAIMRGNRGGRLAVRKGRIAYLVMIQCAAKGKIMTEKELHDQIRALVKGLRKMEDSELAENVALIKVTALMRRWITENVMPKPRKTKR
jgi:hypothetical protein